VSLCYPGLAGKLIAGLGSTCSSEASLGRKRRPQLQF
jgi:hypothetical protein